MNPQIAPPYSILSTAFTQTRQGNTTLVTVTPILTGTVFYFWYLDGIYSGLSLAPQKTFVLLHGTQSRLECVQTLDADFDPLDNAPPGYPAFRTLTFARSGDPTIARYEIQQQANGGSWTTIGYVRDNPAQWMYSFRTPRLTDLTTYAWQVIPISQSGNAGAAVSLSTEYVVRTPDAPFYSLSFNAGTSTVTIAAG